MYDSMRCSRPLVSGSVLLQGIWAWKAQWTRRRQNRSRVLTVLRRSVSPWPVCPANSENYTRCEKQRFNNCAWGA
jgi:hypothetical protein